MKYNSGGDTGLAFGFLSDHVKRDILNILKQEYTVHVDNIMSFENAEYKQKEYHKLKGTLGNCGVELTHPYTHKKIYILHSSRME